MSARRLQSAPAAAGQFTLLINYDRIDHNLYDTSNLFRFMTVSLDRHLGHFA